MKTLAPGPRKRQAIRAPSSPLIFRVFSLSPTVRLRSEPKCYRQSYWSATCSYYRFLLILIIFVSLTRPRLRVLASFKIGRRQVAIVLASVVLPFLFLRPRFPPRGRDPPWIAQPDLALQYVAQLSSAQSLARAVAAICIRQPSIV